MNVYFLKNEVFLEGVKLKRKKLPRYDHCREIFYSDNFVVKISGGDVWNIKDYYGDEQNRLEWNNWKRIKKSKYDSLFFAPVLYCEKYGRYLVQKRFFFTSHKRDQKTRDFVKELCDKYGIGDVDPDLQNYQNLFYHL